jgi:Arc/MetJ-type ribon-helix-helix transcriptional regulator
MPRKATTNVTTLINIRFTPELVERIDALVEGGSASSRTDFVRDAVMFKLYLEENRGVQFTGTPQHRPGNQESKNNS